MPANQVRAALLPDQSPRLLQALHLLTRTGDLNADALRKLKQINHLYGLLRPLLEPLWISDDGQPSGAPLVVDAGAGNSYLGFVLYELLLGPLGRGELWGVETRADLVERVRQRAQDLGFSRMYMAQAAVAGIGAVPELAGRKVDAVVALHACDTATDEALLLGLAQKAAVIAVVPCCQAELARLLSGGSAVRTALGPLWRHPMHRREFGAHLTNVLRGLVLEAHGYQVTVTELTGWEHSLKNEVLLARRVQGRNPLALRQLHQLLAQLPPLPMRLLTELGVVDADGNPLQATEVKS
ncbi:MAG: SAM-dependent methyltransferase [Deltaproteobacteria bacterium]|nr:SAM-dependent methyltransferase [Deltaproteobacteria bacterium]